MAITKYITTEAEQLQQLVKNVNAYIKEGWQPLGAPFQMARYDDGSGLTMVQVMVSDSVEYFK